MKIISDYSLLFFLLLCLFVYWKLRNLYYKRITHKYKYKLYELRDKLRFIELDKKIKLSSCEYLAFSYLDTSISKSIETLFSHSFLLAIFYHHKYKNSEALFEAKQFIKGILSDKQDFALIFQEYQMILYQYSKKRHHLVVGILMYSIYKFFKFTGDLFIANFKQFKKIKSWLSGRKEIIKSHIKDYVYYPETSTAYLMYEESLVPVN